MSQESVLDRVAKIGLVPVITIEQVDHALPLADALLAGGLPVAEITFRTAAAAEVIRALARERPQLIVGAGTVLTLANLEAAKASGAMFGVAPGLNPQIVDGARR
ncbi:MAG TPA: 2-dehydro-3-deoxyphosphogluconate aldolase, partial [Verrucomicrobiae bacterium]